MVLLQQLARWSCLWLRPPQQFPPTLPRLLDSSIPSLVACCGDSYMVSANHESTKPIDVSGPCIPVRDPPSLLGFSGSRYRACLRPDDDVVLDLSWQPEQGHADLGFGPSSTQPPRQTPDAPQPGVASGLKGLGGLGGLRRRPSAMSSYIPPPRSFSRLRWGCRFFRDLYPILYL